MKRLLLVDDEPQLLPILKEHFEGQYEIDTATSGAASATCRSRST
jgi:DNA-binding response OmpR family regulator